MEMNQDLIIGLESYSKSLELKYTDKSLLVYLYLIKDFWVKVEKTEQVELYLNKLNNLIDKVEKYHGVKPSTNI